MVGPLILPRPEERVVGNCNEEVAIVNLHFTFSLIFLPITHKEKPAFASLLFKQEVGVALLASCFA